MLPFIYVIFKRHPTRKLSLDEVEKGQTQEPIFPGRI